MIFMQRPLFSLSFLQMIRRVGKGKNLRDLTTYMNSELQKIANWFRSNKMAINTTKTKFIVFRTRGKRIDPADCNLVFNNNELGQPEMQNLIYPISRIHNDGNEKVLNYWEFTLMNIYPLKNISTTLAQKFQNHYFV
jgi:hypothetical protein